MENPLSVKANAFAISSIMSDQEAAALADTAAMLHAYAYCPTGLQGASSILPTHQRHGGGLSSMSLQLNHGVCRSAATTGADCRFQIDWSNASSGGVHPSQQQQQHHHQPTSGSANDVGEYSSGLKGMEGK